MTEEDELVLDTIFRIHRKSKELFLFERRGREFYKYYRMSLPIDSCIQLFKNNYDYYTVVGTDGYLIIDDGNCGNMKGASQLLLFKTGSHEAFLIRHIGQRRCVSRSGAVFDAKTHRRAVGKREMQEVTRATRPGAVFGQDRIIKQPSPQRHPALG